jgi:hypothetical protein
MLRTPLLLPTPTRHRCGMRVRWCHSPSGRPVCLNAEPSPDGRVVLVLVDERWVAETRRPYRAIALRQQGLPLYAHHHCEL